MSLGKSRWIQKIHWYFTGQLPCLVASISAKGQVRCWQSSRKCAAAVEALTAVTGCVLYIKEGKTSSCVLLLLFLIHARGCLLWLLLPCLILAALPCWLLHVQSLRQNNNSETMLCMVAISLQRALPVQQNESKHLESQLSLIYNR